MVDRADIVWVVWLIPIESLLPIGERRSRRDVRKYRIAVRIDLILACRFILMDDDGVQAGTESRGDGSAEPGDRL